MLKIGFLKNLIIDTIFFNKTSVSFLKCFFKRNGATVLTYHLVCDKNYNAFLRSGDLAQINTDLFKNQLTWLLDNGFSFITIDELTSRIINKEKISSKLIAITFDDGFKITINNVLPVLESLKIKATFFITTDWVDSQVLLWQQKYYWYLENYGLKDFFDKIRQVDKEFFLGLSLSQCHYKFMQEILPERKKRLLEQYNKLIRGEKEIASNIYLDSKDVLRLSSAGMQIGSHSSGHYFMQNLPDDLYLCEMLESKKKLENLIKKPVGSFSYPFNSYREDAEIIKKAGYKTLCTVDSRKIDEFSSLAKLPRFDVPVRKVLFGSGLRKIVYFKK